MINLIRHDGFVYELKPKNQEEPNSLIEQSKDFECIVCYDIYEKVVTTRCCKKPLCIPCYEKLLKPECPSCKKKSLTLDKLEITQLSIIGNMLHTSNIIQKYEDKSTQDAACKHNEFYSGKYSLRALNSFPGHQDDSDSSSDSDSDSSTDSDESYFFAVVQTVFRI